MEKYLKCLLEISDLMHNSDKPMMRIYSKLLHSHYSNYVKNVLNNGTLKNTSHYKLECMNLQEYCGVKLVF
jgi:hypothetical protein